MMIRKIIFIFILLFIFVFSYKKSNVLKDYSKTKELKEEMRAIFVSYMELNTYIQDKTEKESKDNIRKIIKNTKNKNFNTLILQVRSFDDAIYESKYFPISKSILLDDGSYYDVLEFFILECSLNKIDLYLWVNPFRITGRNQEIDNNQYAYSYKNSRVVFKVDDIYYYNPSSIVTFNHILDGIKELVSNYKFKGLLFDDYFYPSNDIDYVEYEEYIKQNSYISLEEYHLMIINNLVENVYRVVKSINKGLLFGISPDGNIENNYNKNYADVRLWGSSTKYLDFLMPQLYYGFNNSSKPFFDTLNEWNKIVTNKNIKLYYALAFYKIGLIDNYAKDGKEEWVLNDDIIKRQVVLLRNASNYYGFSLFRYDYIFNNKYYTQNTLQEINNLDSILDTYK